jgi:predicted extracellular nuclease
MAEVEIVYVAVIPQDNPGIDLVKAVAGIIGKDAYQTRLLLAGSIPRIVARCNGVREAEALARQLRVTSTAVESSQYLC